MKRAAVIGHWVPDYRSNNSKYVVIISNMEPAKVSQISVSSFLSFPSAEMRDKFLEDNIELINIAKPLL